MVPPDVSDRLSCRAYIGQGVNHNPQGSFFFLQCKKVGHGLGGVLGGLRNLALFEVVSTLILAKIYIY